MEMIRAVIFSFTTLSGKTCFFESGSVGCFPSIKKFFWRGEIEKGVVVLLPRESDLRFDQLLQVMDSVLLIFAVAEQIHFERVGDQFAVILIEQHPDLEFVKVFVHAVFLFAPHERKLVQRGCAVKRWQVIKTTVF